MESRGKHHVNAQDALRCHVHVRWRDLPRRHEPSTPRRPGFDSLPLRHLEQTAGVVPALAWNAGHRARGASSTLGCSAIVPRELEAGGGF